MSNSDSSIHRRGFLQAGAAASTAAVAMSGATHSQDTPAATGSEKAKPLTTRELGRTGVQIPILGLGTFRNNSLARMLKFTYAEGIRYYDTADDYGTEPALAQWMETDPAIRKSIFLVTKEHPKAPKELISRLDQRLATLKTDYVDLYLIHGIGAGYPADSLEWPKSQEMRETVEAIKKSGKAKLVGFSCHDGKRAEYLEAAAEGKIFDTLMIQNTAWLDKNTRLNKAIDACHKAGIGLISMKQMAGPNPEAFRAHVEKHAPELLAKGLSPFGALLHAIWSDERFSSTCVSMPNTDLALDNTRSARMFEPLKTAQIEALREAFLASQPTLCADCDGRCAHAGGTTAQLGDITRYLTYYERHGMRKVARQRFAELPAEARDWQGADLQAARDACPSKLDFARLLKRAEDHLA